MLWREAISPRDTVYNGRPPADTNIEDMDETTPYRPSIRQR
jgi:hypothetical protein